MKWFWLLVFLLAASGCAGTSKQTAPPALEASKRLPLEVCQLEGIEESLLCGTFSAPRDWERPDSGEIDIAVVIIPAANGNPDNLAWTEHQGGPGRALLPAASFFTNTVAGRAIRAERDVVLVDQRGVGQSEGLYCEALKDLPILQPYYSAERVSACRRELDERGVDVSHYSTLAAVEDLEHIRRWLGYQQFDVGAWSYGARFMLTYASRYPDSIRTMMLAVPSPFDYRRPLDWARFNQDAIDGLFADCAAEEPCAIVFPNLESDFAAVLDQLQREPVTVEFFNPITEQRSSAEIDRDRFLEVVHVALIKMRPSRMLPLVIHEAAVGNFEPFLVLAVPEKPPRPISEPQYLSVVCPEETAFYTIEEAKAASKATLTGMSYADEFKLACRAWGMPAHADYPLEWRSPDIPTLVISGDRDPITPVEYGQRIADSIPGARHLPIHRMPHDFSGLNHSDCLEGILLEFLETRTPAALNTGCISTMYAPSFYLELPEP